MVRLCYVVFHVRLAHNVVGRFMKIWYMYDDGNKMFHGQYYYHSATCIPRQTAHPYGLFLSDSCANISLKAIYQKCNVYVLKPSEDEPVIGPSDNIYFTGYVTSYSCRTIFFISPQTLLGSTAHEDFRTTQARGRGCPQSLQTWATLRVLRHRKIGQ